MQDSNTISSPPPQNLPETLRARATTGSPNWRQEALAVLLVTLAFAAQVSLGGSWACLSRHYWVDEFFTLSVATDSSATHALSALAHGADFNPPGLHLLLRAYLLPWPAVNEVAVRSFGLLCTGLALLGVYATLRRVYLPLIAGAAALAAFAHPVIVEQAFTARFYAPWLAAAAWGCFFVSRARVIDTRANRFGLACCSLAMCQIHYFGLFTLGLIVAGDWLLHRRVPLRPANLLCLALGPISLAACIPLYLGQRGALTAATWIEAINSRQIEMFMRILVPTTALATAALCWWLSFPRRLAKRPAQAWTINTNLSQFPAPEETQTLAGLTALIGLMPLLMLFSWLVQPTLIPRYGVVAAMSFAPILAALLARTSRSLVVLACVWFVAFGVLQHRAYTAHAMQDTEYVDRLIGQLRLAPGNQPILFESPHDLFPVVRYAPDLAERCYYLDFETAQVKNASNFRVIDRDLTRRQAALFGAYQLLPLARLSSLTDCLLVQSRFDFESELGGYPGFQQQPLGPKVMLLRRQATEPGEAAPQ